MAVRLNMCETCTLCLEGKGRIHHETETDWGKFDGLQNGPEMPRDIKYLHHSCPTELMEAAEKSCQLCCALVDRIGPQRQRAILQEFAEMRKLERELDDRTLDDPHSFMLMTITFTQDTYTVTLSGTYLGRIHLRRHLMRLIDGENGTRFSFVSRDSKALTSQVLFPQSSSTSAVESSDLAKIWMDICETNCGPCNSERSGNWMPTRLLDLAGEHATQDHVRLIESQDQSSLDRYATLSHCWGDAKFKRLLRSNLEEFKQSIDLQSLTKTFVHAIKICRRLGLRYLWIDSLCIMQDRDDLSDWLKEGQVMDQVYANAHINIAATASSDSSQGLFRDRNPASFRTIVWTRDAVAQQCVVPPGEYIVLDPEYWHDNVNRAPLLSRAWVFQERLLARRMLHFTEHELMWECHGFHASESFSIVPSWLYPLKDIKSKLAQPDFSERLIYTIWNYIIEEYSELRLTQNDDKPIAIAGVAKQFALLLPDDEYVVGMWKHRLDMQILWYVLKIRDSTQKRKHPVPSFSWLSVDSPVRGNVNERGLLISVVDVTINYVTDDTTGLTRGGQITINGYLRRLVWVPAEYHDNGTEEADTYVYEGLYVRDSEQPLKRIYLGPAVYYDSTASLHLISADDAMVFCLLGREDEGGWLECLVLVCDDIKNAVFHRVGALHTIEESHVLLAPQVDEASFPCSLYEPTTGKHTFHLH